jgi:hypothetical protein
MLINNSKEGGRRRGIFYSLKEEISLKDYN